MHTDNFSFGPNKITPKKTTEERIKILEDTVESLWSLLHKHINELSVETNRLTGIVENIQENQRDLVRIVGKQVDEHP
jgi:hypothetical protein